MEEKPVIPEKDQAMRDWLAHYGREAVGPVIFLTFLALIGTGLGLLSPWPIKILTDSVFGFQPAPGFLDQYRQTIQLVYWVAAMIGGLFFISRIFGYIKGYADNYFTFKLGAQVNRDFYLHILRLPRNVKALHNNSDYVFRLINEAGSVSGLLLGTSITVLQSVISIIFIFILLMLINPGMTMLSLSIVPFLFLSIRFFGKHLERLAVQQEEASIGIHRFISESIRGSAIIQAFNREPAHHEHYYKMQTRNYKLRVKQMLLGNTFDTVNGTLNLLATILVIVVGSKQYFDGYLTFGEILIFISYLGSLYGPLDALSNAIEGYREQMVAIRRVFDYIYDLPEQQNVVDNPIHTHRVNGQLIYQNVSVYANKTPILNNINLTIQPGQKVALIGPSGSGKSTLLSLAPRLSTWTSGNIYLDGQEVRTYDLDSLRQQYAYVEQESTIFSDSIFGNVAFGKPEGTTNLAEATAALGAAHAYDFVKTMPQGFDTIIGDGGLALSGGQKQRIAIARAFLRNAPVLLLDEPLSALDAGNQHGIVTSILELMQGRTVLMVSHDLGLLQHMDAIYVIEGGVLRDVSEYGGIEAYHDVLLAQSQQAA